MALASSDVVITVGDHARLGFDVAWEQPRPAGTADEASWGSLTAYVEGAAVWREDPQGESTSVRWPLVELLEHLAGAWHYLLREEVDPLGLGMRPDLVRGEAQQLWEDIPEARRIEEQRALRS